MAVIYNWACQDFEGITGYKHNVEIPDEEVFDIVKKVFDAGLYVMLKKGEPTILYIDDRRFAQR